jgi:hypothetical protein
MSMIEVNEQQTIIGWREWVALPSLGIPAIKAKIDTGAKTSALHAFAIEAYLDGEVERVRFSMHPLRRRQDIVVECNAPILDRRLVRSSSGAQEERIVIETTVGLGEASFTTPVTLTSREDMLFRMLIGRRALATAGMIVEVSTSYRLGAIKRENYSKYYPGA